MNSNGLPQNQAPQSDNYNLHNLLAMQGVNGGIMGGQNQWIQAAMISQNPLFPSQLPNTNFSSWPQPQQFPNQNPNAIIGSSQNHLAGFNGLSSMFPPNIIQDVLRMSMPVGSSRDDDTLLVNVLRDSAMKGQTYRQAIETLHGVNNHAATLWKDYYLDHKPRLDLLVSQQPNLSTKTAKKTQPLVSSLSQRNDSPASLSSQQPMKRSGPSAFYSSAISTGTLEATKRRTINSITAHAPIQDLDKNLLPPHASIQIPNPPSRSPSPPRHVVPGVRGNRYTPQDKDYFIQFISYELNRNPSLKKIELCEKLAEKAPHHSATSWASHWHSRHDIADKILAAAKGDNSCSDSDNATHSLKGENEGKAGHTANHVDSAPDSEHESGQEGGSDSEDGEGDEYEMGLAGGPFTDADMRVLAKYMASIPNWTAQSSTERWMEFHRRYSTRSPKSWAEYYRRREKAIDKLVQKYRKCAEKPAPIQPQRGRPTWAHNAHTIVTISKRKFKGDDEDDDEDDADNHFDSKRHRNSTL